MPAFRPPRPSGAGVPSALGLPIFVAFLVLRQTLHVLLLADVYFYGEELEKGAVAKALTDLDLPFWRLPYHFFEGGSIAIGWLNAALYPLLGESVLAHKVAALLVAIATLVVGDRVVRRHFGEASALLFRALFVLAPAGYQKLFSLSLGTHHEAILFVLAALGLALTILESPAPRARQYALLGLVLGFGSWFNFHVLLVAIYLFVLLVGLKPRESLRPSGLVGLAGYALGALPLFLTLAHAGPRITDVHGSSLTERTLDLEAIERAAASIFDGDPLRLVQSGAWILAFLLCLPRAVAAWKTRLLVGLILFWLVAFVTSDFLLRIRHFSNLTRYALPWILQVMILAAVVPCLRARPVALLARAAVAVLLACGLAASAHIALGGTSPAEIPVNLRRIATTKGYDYAGYLERLWPRLDDIPLERRIELLLGFDEPDPEFLAYDLGRVVLREVEDPAAVLARHPQLALGRGLRLAQRSHWAFRSAVARALDAPPPERPARLKALGRTGTSLNHSADTLGAELAELAPLPLAEQRAFARGQGARACRYFVFSPRGGPDSILRPAVVRERIGRRVPPPLRAAWAAGYDQALEQMRVK